MFTKYIGTVLAILTERGLFDTTPENVVKATLEILEGLILADQIATQGEIADATAVRTAEESTITDVKAHLLSALNRVRVLKAFSGQAELPIQTSDELWREADLLQADLELALDRVAPEELSDWLDSKW
jgi:hypothetical protein